MHLSGTSKVHPYPSIVDETGGSKSPANDDAQWAVHSSNGGVIITGTINSDPLTYDSIGSTDISNMESSNNYEGRDVEFGPHHATREVKLQLHNISDMDGDPNKTPDKNESNGAEYYMQVQSAPYRRLEHPADRSLMLAFLASLIFLISALVVLAPAVIIIFVFLPISLVIRNCMACCCCCHPNRSCSCCCMHSMSHSDLVWLNDSELNRAVSQSLICLESGIDLVQLRHLLNVRLVAIEGKSGTRLYPRFMTRVVPLYAGYSWIHDHDFSMENHVFPMPARIRTQHELQQYVAKQATVPLSRDRPLWEIQVQNSLKRS